MMPRQDVTQDRLMELLNYDPVSGIFTWLVSRGSKKAGAEAGHVHPPSRGSTLYVTIGIDGVTYLAHRLAWLYVTGQWPTDQIDHRDRCGTHNNWKNLRDVNQIGNSQNVFRPHRNSTTGILGVFKRGDKFRSKIRFGGRLNCLGTFATKEEASEAYMQAKKTYHPFFEFGT